jgi:hypothetical protein
MKASSTSSPNALHKSPPFKILIGLTGALVFLSLFMYTQLEHISRDDDVLPGSSGGDGQAWDMRSAMKKHHAKNKRANGLLDFVRPGRKSMKEQIEAFADWKIHDKKRRTQNGVLSSREEYERDHSYGSDEELQQKVQQTLRIPDLPVVKTDIPYDIYNCPDHPPPNYPFAWNVRLVLENWNPDNTDMPSQIYQGLCVFDWKKDYQKAVHYREAELPFVLQHAPEVMKASLRWMHENYMNDLVGDEPIRNEHSHNNHFMYWKTNHPVPNFNPPTDMVELTFADWYTHAQELDQMSAHDQISQEHWYFRLNAMLEKHGYVYEELPFFDPSLGTSMTMINPEEHRGINCRFGMKGITAETHFDSSSNFIALMGGQRRYVHSDKNARGSVIVL